MYTKIATCQWAEAIDRARGFCEDSTLGESAILGDRDRAAFIFDGEGEEKDNTTLLCGDISVETPESTALNSHCAESVRRVMEAMRSACKTYHDRVPTACTQSADGKMDCKPVQDIPKRVLNPGFAKPNKPDPVFQADRKQ